MKRSRILVVFKLSFLMILGVVLVALQGATQVASLESGPTRRALKLNGTNAYLEVDSGPVLADLGAITIEAWVYRRDQSGCETIVGHNFKESYWFGFCGTKLNFFAHGEGLAVSSSGDIPAGVWTHVAVSYNGAVAVFYINGQWDYTRDFAGGVASSTSPVGIGVDIATLDEEYENYFRGMLDEVRIWGIARPGADIQADMWREIGEAGGLLGVWRMNGAPEDLLGRNHTSEIGDVRYDTGGVLPFGLHIPVTENLPDIDGTCEPGEYNVAERVALRRGERTVYLQHNEDDLFVCIEGLWQDAGGDDEVIVAIDPNLSRDPVAKENDYRYILERDGDTRAERGDGSGGFIPFAPPSESWEAAAFIEFEFYWRAEFRISRHTPEDWAEIIGLDIVAKGEPPANHFPAGAIENNPETWSPVIIRDDDPAVAPVHRLSGQVRDPAGIGIPDVTVRLYSANGGIGGRLLFIASTDEDGNYAFEYHGYAPNWFRVVEEDPRGAYSVDSDAGADGEAISYNVLAYPGAQEGKTYSPGYFVDTRDFTGGRSLRRAYLIIYGDPVEPSDLTELVEMKRLQGFQVEAISVETIESTVTGPDRQTKIRNWLKSRWQAHRPNDVYALLIGHGGVIPTPDYGLRLEDPPVYPEDAGYIPTVRTDWFYADLDSNWDVDGDRHVGECLKHDDVDEPICMNPDDPIYHEGPFGTSLGREDDWVPEISIGRIGLVTRAEVRSALATSVAAESSGSLDKRQGVVAGAFWWPENQPWDATTGTYAAGNWDGTRPYGNDSAEALESGLRPILEEHLESFTTLYNSTKPDNPTALSPTRFVPDIPLTFANFENYWRNEAFGLANLAGHGDWHGVYIGELWTKDWDRPGIINNPADPATCPDPPCLEMEWDGFLMHHAFPPTSGEVAPVVYAQACGTGEVGWFCDFSARPLVCRPGRYAIASTLPMRGAAAAWIGASMTHTTGGITDQLQHRFNADLLGTPLLLGDALWKNNQWVASFSRTPDWRTVNMMVNGDPAYSYWGNPLDMRAYWPQAGRDWFGSSASPASGPSAGIRRWVSAEGGAGAASSIDRDGNIYTVYTNSIVVRAPDGTIIDSQDLPLAGGTAFPPTITTDGVYVATANHLTALDLDLNIRDTVPATVFERPPVGPAVAGPDGVIWWPLTAHVVRYTPGNWQEIVSDQVITSRVTLTPSGAVVWARGDGSLQRYRMDRHGNASSSILLPSGPSLTDPVSAPRGYIVAGRGSEVVWIDDTIGGVRYAFNTGSTVTSAPAVSPDGTVYAGNQAGEVVALFHGGTLGWRRSLGAPILSTPATDEARVYVTAGSRLHALDIASGDVVWSVDLGGPVDYRGGPVIGSNRTIYITRSDGRVVAVGPHLWLVAPSDLLLESTGGGVTVRWRDNTTDELGFRIERCDGAGCVFVASAPADAEMLTINQQPVGEMFRYRIQAVGGLSESRSSSAAMESSDFIYSPVVEVMPPPPAVPANLSAAADSSQSIDLAWTYAGDPDLLLGFDIYRATAAAGPYELVGIAHSGDRSYQDVGLEPDTTYYYKVATVNAAGPSSQAGPQSATTKPQSLPAPTNLAGSYNDGDVKLSWKDNATTETGYLIEREVPGGIFDAIALLPANATSYTDHYLLVEGTNSYRVRAVSEPSDSPPAETQVEVTGPPRQSFFPIIRR